MSRRRSRPNPAPDARLPAPEHGGAAGSAPQADPVPPSKTRQKQQMHALQSLGQRLVELTDAELSSLPLPERLHDAVVQCRDIRSHEGRRRQMQFIGKLMRHVDPEPIVALFDERGAAHHRDVLAQHAAESWRDRLLAGEATLERFTDAHPVARPEPLQRLLEQARREREAGQPPRGARLLYRALYRTMLDADDADDTTRATRAPAHDAGADDAAGAGAVTAPPGPPMTDEESR